ncbi:MAG: hypothetical protein VXW32_15320, partial [Myxococcota bacterium]|nr:hypothetical protein [Myxococcota bacterium]
MRRPAVFSMALLVLGCRPAAPLDADLLETGENDSGTRETGGLETGSSETGESDGLPAICQVDARDGSEAPAPALSREELVSGSSPTGLVDEAAFRAAAGAGTPLHTFEGRLRIRPTFEQRTVHEAEGWISSEMRDGRLPEVEAEWVQCGEVLAPIQRGRQIGSDDSWDVMLSPGRIWSNPADGGASRVALPFTVVPKTFNCVHNGSMTFLFDGESVSDVRYQLAQETCHFLKFDAWGRADAEWTPEPSEAAAAGREALALELENRIPVKDFAALEAAYPDAGISELDGLLTLSDISARGVLTDGTLYLEDCRTRAGSYSFCEDIVLPSFSLAKTLYAGVGLAAMAQEFSEDPHAQTLGDLLGAQGTWAGVTVENALDMATGHYLFENQQDADIPGFYSSLELEGRLAATFDLPKRREPGQRVVYLTPNTQAVSAAMDVFLERQGADLVDSFDYLVDRVLKPLGVPPESFHSLRTWESGGANNGTAFGGYGMWFTPQGVAKLGDFLQRGGDGLLAAEPWAQMMFQSEDRGAPMNYYQYRYNNGMWAWPVSGCNKLAPILFGVSGITVILPPNGQVH